MADKEPNKESNKTKSKADENQKHFLMEKFSEYRGEFRKIVWPSRADLLKHTLTTIVISLIFGVFIAILDGIFGTTFRAAVNWFIS